MFLSAIFLTLIVAIMAQMILISNAKVQQRNSTLYFTAVNLANEQFAILEGGGTFPAEDLKSYNGMKNTATPIEFNVSITNQTPITENLIEVTVKVEWTVNGETKNLISTKTISQSISN